MVKINTDLPQSYSSLSDGYEAMADFILKNSGSDPVVIAGIRNSGATVADRVAHHLREKGVDVFEGMLDTVPSNNGRLSSVGLGYINGDEYRDDIMVNDIPHAKENTSIPLNTLGNPEIYVIDDVIDTGRTVRTALEEILPYQGTSVKLLALADRGKDRREVPIQPDYAFINADNLYADQKITLQPGDDKSGSLDEFTINEEKKLAS